VHLWYIKKLKIENDAVGFTKADPFLARDVDSILNQFTACTKEATQLVPLMSEIRNNEMKLFGMWQNNSQLSLLHPNRQMKQELYSLYLKNERILKRLAIKLDKSHYPKLQDALFMAAIHLEERMPKIQSVESKSAFPDSGAELLIDLVNYLRLQ